MLPRSRKRCSRLMACLLLVTTFLLAPRTHAQDQVSATAWGLRGIDRIQLPTSNAPELVLAGGASYGHFESQGAVQGAHHRAAGSLAVGVAATSFLGAALRFDGRHDVHPDDGTGGDTSSVGDPRLLVRAGSALDAHWSLGGELALWVPGQDAPSVKLGASTLDARLTGAYESSERAPRWTVGAQVGYRLDNSAAAAPARTTLRPGDRLTLAVSDFDAVLAAVGVVHRRGALELLTELSWDVLVGASAPRLLESPLRIVLGARYALSESLTLALSAMLSPSQRPSQSVVDRFVPIEPRLGIEAGVRLGFGPSRRAETAAEPLVAATEPAAAVPEPPLPAAPAIAARLEGRLLDADGSPIAGAHVSRLAGQPPTAAATTDTDAEGRFALTDVPVGSVQLRAEQPGFEPREWSIDVAHDVAQLPDATLARVPMGQLRGVALSFRGKPVKAQLALQSLTQQDAAPSVLQADADGGFRIDVAPGRYRVEVTASGYAPQTHEVSIEDGAVMILNVDLRKAGRAP